MSLPANLPGVVYYSQRYTFAIRFSCVRAVFDEGFNADSMSSGDVSALFNMSSRLFFHSYNAHLRRKGETALPYDAVVDIIDDIVDDVGGFQNFVEPLMEAMTVAVMGVKEGKPTVA